MLKIIFLTFWIRISIGLLTWTKSSRKVSWAVNGLSEVSVSDSIVRLHRRHVNVIIESDSNTILRAKGILRWHSGKSITVGVEIVIRGVCIWSRLKVLISICLVIPGNIRLVLNVKCTWKKLMFSYESTRLADHEIFSKYPKFRENSKSQKIQHFVMRKQRASS